MLNINAPNSFIQNVSNFFGIILDFFNKFSKLEVEQVGKRRAEIGPRRENLKIKFWKNTVLKLQFEE